MATVIVRHRVADFDDWKRIYDEHKRTRDEYGLAERSLHRDEDDANMVSIIYSADDLARARELVSSDDLRETMRRAGVVSQPEIWLRNDV